MPPPPSFKPEPWPRRAIKACIGRAASARAFDRPVFILAPPRSGSSLLFECLARCEPVFHLDAEADLYWWRQFPYQRSQSHSDAVGAAEASPAQLRTLWRVIYRQAAIAQLRRHGRPLHPGYLLGTRPIRYLDKTIANCFHLEVLDRSFPNARFVLLVRDPRPSLASMIEGWPHRERFGKPQLGAVLRTLQPRAIEHWSYPAPPGWQQVVGRSLAEICAWSWRQHVEAVLAFFEREARPLVRLTYEQLVHDPARTVRTLAEELDLPWSAQAEAYVGAAPLSRTTVSKPERDKWRGRHAAEIERVVPTIRETAARIGYDLARDPTG
jgi:Sulfotransferase family